MTQPSDRIVADFQKLVADLQALLAATQQAAGERISDHIEGAAVGLRSALDAAQRRAGHLEAELERRLGRTPKPAPHPVRWSAVASTAAVAFVLGACVFGATRH